MIPPGTDLDNDVPMWGVKFCGNNDPHLIHGWVEGRIRGWRCLGVWSQDEIESIRRRARARRDGAA